MSSRFRSFVEAVEHAVSSATNEDALMGEVVPAMARLVEKDDWLPSEAAQSHPDFYQQHLLHLDPQSRFSVVSFVWGAGQSTPVHDHKTWGVIGMLRGSERAQAYRKTSQGLVAHGEEQQLEPGQVVVVSPALGDIHRVRNAHGDRVSISIHVYGADIGSQRRHTYDVATGATKEFVSGYSHRRGAA